MTSKFEGQDPTSAATNHNRRHSGGQGHKSKLVPVDGEPRKTKDEQQHQHGLTNGHASREERRGSSDCHGKPQSDNKENAQGQNGKEDNPEKKKKRKRKKKKGAGGGGNAGTGGGNANGNGECVREAVESESRLAGTDGALRRGRLTHTSSEEHSDEPGSTHADVNGLEIHPIPQVQSDTSSNQPASASESLGREPIDNQIDLGQKIDTESTNITVSSSGTIQACDVECTLQTSGGSVNNVRASGEGFALDRSALVEQHDMSHGAEGHSKSLDLSCENEGSSVDAELKDAEDFEENDLFIQEDSDLSGKVSGSGTDSGTECSSDTSTSEQLPSGEDILGKDVTDQPNGLLHIEQPVPDMREDKDTSSAEKPGKHNSEQNELGDETGEGNSQLEDSGSLPREHDYVQDIPPASTQGGDGNEQDEIIHNSGQDFPKNVPGGDTSDQAALENCTRSHLDIEYSVSENNEDPESCSSPEENGHIRLEKDKEHDGGCAPRSKREISVVDLIGARSTAGSAIRAGIIQDMMLTSGSSGQPAGTGSSMSKTDFTGCVDVAGDGESEKSSGLMTQQKQHQQEELSGVETTGNGSSDSGMDPEHLQEHTERQLPEGLKEQEQTTPGEEPLEARSRVSVSVVDPVETGSKLRQDDDDDEALQKERSESSGQEPQTDTTSGRQNDAGETSGEQQQRETDDACLQQHETGDTCLEQHETGDRADEAQLQEHQTTTGSLLQQGKEFVEKHGELLEKHHGSIEWHDEAMTNLQAHAQAQQAKANLAITSLRARLRRRDIELRTAREGHERQMTAVVAHLLRLEGEMQKEQKQVIEALADRDDIIRRQKMAIDDLTEKNERLMKALKESQQYLASSRVPQQNGDISIRDHGNKVVIRGTKGRSSDRSLKSSSGEFKSGNGDKPKVRFTTAMMERLRRHKSSLELYRPERLEPLFEGSLRYFSSQDNLVDDEGEGGEEASKEEVIKDKTNTPVRREGNLQKKQRCRSLVDYPFVGEQEEGEGEEVGGSSESCYEEGFTPSPTRISRHDSGLSSSMSSLTGSSETPTWVRRWSGGGGGGINGGMRPRGKSADLSSSPHSPLSPSSPNSFSPSPKLSPSPSPSPSSLSKASSPHGFSELSKSRSVPHALPTVSENDAAAAAAVGPPGSAGKERPHSYTSVEMLTRDLSSSSSANSTSTPNLTPATSSSTLTFSSSPPSSSSESNPFKSFKNVFKRRGSKKKRSVALNHPGSQERTETVKQYFKKHDLT